MDIDDIVRLEPFDPKKDTLPEPEPEQQTETANEPEPEEEPAPESEPEPASEPESEPEAKVEGTEPAPEPESEEPESEEPERGKDKDALLKELKRLRQQLASKPAPPPAQQTTAPAQQNPYQPALPLQVSEDGTSVFIDPVAMAAYTRQIAHEEAVRLNTPTPEQIRSARIQQATQDYVSHGPSAVKTVETVKQADDFLTKHLLTLQQQGHQFTSFDDALGQLKALGIDEQFYQYFPEMKQIGMDDFVEAMASGLPSVRKLLFDRVTMAREKTKAKPKTNGAPRKLGDQPKSMTRKGGGRGTVLTSAHQEFKALEAEFNADVAKFPDTKFQRLKRLGRDLEIEGY